MLGHEAGGLVLLDDMRQFVGQEVGSLGAIGREFAGSEDDVTADRERPGLDGRRRGRRAGVGVHADLAEIAPNRASNVARTGALKGTPGERSTSRIRGGTGPFFPTRRASDGSRATRFF